MTSKQPKTPGDGAAALTRALRERCGIKEIDVIPGYREARRKLIEDAQGGGDTDDSDDE